MNGYTLGVFIVCLVFGSISLLSESEGKERLLTAILTLWLILSPLASLLSMGEGENILATLKPPESEVGEEYLIAVEEAFCEGIISLVAEEFELDRSDVRVSLSSFDARKMSAEKIRITLSGKAVIADYKAIEKRINELNLGEANVEIEIG